MKALSGHDVTRAAYVIPHEIQIQRTTPSSSPTITQTQMPSPTPTPTSTTTAPPQPTSPQAAPTAPTFPTTTATAAATTARPGAVPSMPVGTGQPTPYARAAYSGYRQNTSAMEPPFQQQQQQEPAGETLLGRLGRWVDAVNNRLVETRIAGDAKGKGVAKG